MYSISKMETPFLTHVFIRSDAVNGSKLGETPTSPPPPPKKKESFEHNPVNIMAFLVENIPMWNQ